MKIRYCILILLLSVSLYNAQAQEAEWYDECKSSKVIDNILFIFPSGIADIELREYYIQKNLTSIKECLDIINESDFTDTVEVEFLKDRSQMKKYLGWPASGMAYPDRKVMFCILAEKTPIKHEWMHMITMLKWGIPDQTLTWMNEGLATYADKCLEYSNEKVYSYFIQSDKLINADGLVNNFYKQDDVIAYFQAAYLVEYLIKEYGITKFKQLWKYEISKFSHIYEKSLDEVVEEINNTLKEKYPTKVDIDWEVLEKGCY